MEDLVVPELEEAKRKITSLVEYFAKQFPPGRSRDAIVHKARALGLQAMHRKPTVPED